MMIKRVKQLVILGLVTGAVGLILAYNNFLKPAVTSARLPDSDIVVAAIVVLIFLAGKLPSYFNDLIWRRAGRAVGLTARGGPTFESGPPDKSGKATLTGTVEGRPVRARVYNTQSSRDQQSTTTTVVETELRNPVDWQAAFFPEAAEETPEDPGVDAAKMQVTNGLTITGDISEETAEAVATRRVEDAVKSLNGAVGVGDVGGHIVDDMTEKIEDETDGMAGTLAKGLGDVAGAGNDGPDRTVKHRNTGLCTDETELQRRVDAVTTVADAVETSSR